MWKRRGRPPKLKYVMLLGRATARDGTFSETNLNLLVATGGVVCRAEVAPSLLEHRGGLSGAE
jgi:hypothetical protein